MAKDDQDPMSKAERKQARSEMAAQAQGSAHPGGGFAGLVRAEAHAAAAGSNAPRGWWLERESDWEKSERKARMHVSWYATAGLVLPVLAVSKVFEDPDGYTSTQTLVAHVVRVALVALIAWVLWNGQKAVQNPLVAVWNQRRAEVVWAYTNDVTTITAGRSFKHQSATLALADGTSVATQTHLAPGDFQEIAAGLPNAVVGYSDARRAAFARDPRSVR